MDQRLIGPKGHRASLEDDLALRHHDVTVGERQQIVEIFVDHDRGNAASRDEPPPPSRAALGADYRELPPEPRLQGVPGHRADPQQDLRDKLKADTEANRKFEWIDESSGIAQIPVKEAMKIIAEKGLPGAPVPPAEKKK